MIIGDIDVLVALFDADDQHINVAGIGTLERGPLVVPTPVMIETCYFVVERYADFPLGAVDAFVIALVEALIVTDIATLDHRHFRAFGHGTWSPSRSFRRVGPPFTVAGAIR